MKTYHLLALAGLVSGTASAAVVTNTLVQNKLQNWSHMVGVTATQTSNNGGGNVANATRAIDGNYNGAWAGGSVTHTAGTTPPGQYWQVDLGATRWVNGVKLFNRTDCCGGRLAGVSVLASDDVSFSTTVYDSGTLLNDPGAYTGVSLEGVNARYVRVRRDIGTNPISLAEVDVLGSNRTYRSIAMTGTASQSGTASGGVASRAVDGVLARAYNAGNTTHTNNAANSLWEVSFGELYKINEIVLHNRGDCCQDRLSNFRVSVWDGGTEVWGDDYFSTGNPGDIFSISEDSGLWFAEGDRVRIQLNGLNNAGNGTLSLLEVEVFAVPEPSSASLLGLAGVAFLFRRRK